MSMTNSLIAIVEGRKPSKINLKSIIDSAAKNKILLHVLRVLNFHEPLRRTQESRMRRTIQVVQTLSATLKNYDYAFFKLIKPVAYVPADVDLLIDSGQAGRAAKEVMRLGYKIAVKDPYCITLIKASSIIDLYIHPSLGGIVFINGQRLLEHTSIRELNGIEVKALESYAEALAVASHAIYKERIYTLNDYFTTQKWTTQKTYKLAQELKCENAIKTALNLNRKIRQGLLEIPHKISTPVWLTILMQKFRRDRLTRTTSTNILKKLANKRTAKLLISKLTRETY